MLLISSAAIFSGVAVAFEHDPIPVTSIDHCPPIADFPENSWARINMLCEDAGCVFDDGPDCRLQDEPNVWRSCEPVCHPIGWTPVNDENMFPKDYWAPATGECTIEKVNNISYDDDTFELVDSTVHEDCRPCIEDCEAEDYDEQAEMLTCMYECTTNHNPACTFEEIDDLEEKRRDLTPEEREELGAKAAEKGSMDIDDWYKGLKGSCNTCIESCANEALLPMFIALNKFTEMEMSYEALDNANNMFMACFTCCGGFEPKDVMPNSGIELDTCDAMFGDINFLGTSNDSSDDDSAANDSSDDDSALEWYWILLIVVGVGAVLAACAGLIYKLC